MKSYFLNGIERPEMIESSSSAVLPFENHTWVLLASPKDPIAYFALALSEEDSSPTMIQADISGRHYESDGPVVEVLENLRKILGGEISYAP